MASAHSRPSSREVRTAENTSPNAVETAAALARTVGGGWLAPAGRRGSTRMEVRGIVTSSPARLIALLTAFIAGAVLPALAQSLPATTTDGAESALEPGGLRDSRDADPEWTHWTSGRYRITPGDVLEFTFPFVPELNQSVAVQPDGYITLKDISDLRAQGRTVAQVKADVLAAYAPFVRDPVVTVALKQFETPYFVAGGAVANVLRRAGRAPPPVPARHRVLSRARGRCDCRGPDGDSVVPRRNEDPRETGSSRFGCQRRRRRTPRRAR